MRLIRQQDHGAEAIALSYHSSEQIRGKIHVGETGMFFCSNSPNLHGENCPDKFGYKYSYRVGIEILQKGDGSSLKWVKLLEQTVIVKRGNNGDLFRRLYKQEDNLIYVGTIQKDIEDCKKPSSTINIMDEEFLKENGWNEYQKEESAEEKLGRVSRPSK